MRLLIVLALSWPASCLAAGSEGVVLVVADGLGASALDYALSRPGKDGTASLPSLRAFLREARASLVSTRSADSPITDSAAAATAMACGAKARNGSLGLDASGKPLVCLGRLAKEGGKALGLVTTTEIWDATPAAFAARAASRKDRAEILRQIDELRPDVALGQDRPGPFGGKGPLELPRAARHALDAVSARPGGYFLLVETERTDETCHDNDLPGFLAAMEELDRTLAVLLEHQERHPQTSLVLTADHETGGLGVYPGRPEPSWLTGGHTGAPVLLFALGPAARDLPGAMDNTEVFRVLARALGLPVGAPPRD